MRPSSTVHNLNYGVTVGRGASQCARAGQSTHSVGLPINGWIPTRFGRIAMRPYPIRRGARPLFVGSIGLGWRTTLIEYDVLLAQSCLCTIHYPIPFALCSLFSGLALWYHWA